MTIAFHRGDRARFLVRAALALLLATGAACGLGRPPAVSPGQGVDPATVAALVEEGDGDWAHRDEPGAVDDAVGRYEAAWQLVPSDRVVLGRLVRARLLSGDLANDADLRTNRWKSAEDLSWACLAERQGIVPGREAPASDWLPRMTGEDVPCLYVVALAMDRIAHADGVARWMADVELVRAIMERIRVLSPTWDCHGPSRYLGSLYASLPFYAGQDLDHAARLFQESIAGSPQCLSNHLAYAESWAVHAGNRGLFDSEIAKVIKAPDAQGSELALESRLAKQRALVLSAQADALFASSKARTEGP
jgi:hypothetical protein